MAGELSEDQARFVSRLSSATGMSSAVVKAWVGCESGWQVTKPTHNYLNIGPGRSYRSTGEAVDDAAGEIRVRGWGNLSAGAQVLAISNSDWGTRAQCICDVAKELGVDADCSHDTAPLGPLTPIIDTPGDAVDAVGDAASGVAGAVVSGLQKLIAPVGKALLTVFLAAIFTAAGLALIGLGILRLTGRDARDALATAGGAAGLAAAVA